MATKYRKGQFLLVPNKEKILGLRGAPLNVFLAICGYADENGGCFPSYSTLAKDTLYSIRACKIAIDDLVADGLLTKEIRTRENGSHSSNYYQIHLLEGVVNSTTPPSELDFTPITKPINKEPKGSNRNFLVDLISRVNPREKPTEERQRLLRGRQKDYTDEEITKAAIAFSKSDWHKENGQMSIDNLLAPSKFGRWYTAGLNEKIVAPVDEKAKKEREAREAEEARRFREAE